MEQPNLKSDSISIHCNLTPNQIENIIHHVITLRIKKLDLSKCNIRKRKLQFLIDHLVRKFFNNDSIVLQEINLSNNMLMKCVNFGIDKLKLDFLFNSIMSLHIINLSNNYINTDAFINICTMISPNSPVSTLIFNTNCIRDDGFEYFCKNVLMHNKTITHIEFHSCKLTSKSVQSILDVLLHNHSLLYVGLNNNDISQPEYAIIRKLLSINETKKYATRETNDPAEWIINSQMCTLIPLCLLHDIYDVNVMYYMCT
jgi:hypothetical protein